MRAPASEVAWFDLPHRHKEAVPQLSYQLAQMWGKRRAVRLESCQWLSIKNGVTHFFFYKGTQRRFRWGCKAFGELNVHFKWDFRYKRRSIDCFKFLVAVFQIIMKTSHDEFSVITLFLVLQCLGPSVSLSFVARLVSASILLLF